jgi:hypothetical protein
MNAIEQSVDQILKSVNSDYMLFKHEDLEYYKERAVLSYDLEMSLSVSVKQMRIIRDRSQILSFQNRILKFELQYIKIWRLPL